MTFFINTYRKIKPTGTERTIWNEGSGETLTTYQTGIGKLGGLICWENYMPLARMSMFRKGVEIYIAPTADARETWISTLQHIALEGRCFVLGCNQICRGGSVIVSPFGTILAGPLYDKEGLLTAILDLDDITNSKLDFDVNGHYARNDIFTFDVKDQPPITKE